MNVCELCAIAYNQNLDSADLTFCIEKRKILLLLLDKLKEDAFEKISELAKFIATVDWIRILWRFIAYVLDSLCISRSGYVDAISACLKNWFDNFQSPSVIKGVIILDVTAWPRKCDDSPSIPGEGASSLVEYLKLLLLKRDVLVTKIIEEWTTFKSTTLIQLMSKAQSFGLGWFDFLVRRSLTWKLC